MGLTSNSGAMGKNKNIKVAFSGNFKHIICDDVEFLSIEKPETAENESEEIQTNKRTIKDDVANQGWEDWSGLEVFNDAAGANWKAFIDEQRADTTGTVTISASSDGTTFSPILTVLAKIAKAGGGGGDASGFDSGFTPTIRILGTATATQS